MSELIAVLSVSSMTGGALAWTRQHSRNGECGTYWARVVLWTTASLSSALCLSYVVAWRWPTVPLLQFDVSGSLFGWAPSRLYPYALATPIVIWSLVLVACGYSRWPERAPGAWLAGAVGDDGSRRWVLWCAAAIGVCLTATANGLGGGSAAYPAAAWGTGLVVAFSLVGVAFSSGAAPAEPAAAQGPRSAPQLTLRDWPVAVRELGIESRRIVNVNASPTASGQITRSGPVRRRLLHLGAASVAAKVVEAAEDLVGAGHAQSSSPRNRVVFAPDDCGQVEVTAAAAAITALRFDEKTVVVTYDRASQLADRFRPWGLKGERVKVASSATDLHDDAWLFVVDASTLAERILPEISDDTAIGRVGLIVWWDLHSYSGVAAANLWVVTRRFNQLVKRYRHRRTRTLGYMRSFAVGDTQATRFVRRLLPDLTDSWEVHVESVVRRPLAVHLLTSHQRAFEIAANQGLGSRWRHPLLVAARASTEQGWPTAIAPTADITSTELDTALAGSDRHRENLRASKAQAGAFIGQLGPADVLSVKEIIGQLGRAAEHEGSVHFAMTMHPNPYVAYWLAPERLTKLLSGDENAWRRLVCSEGHPGVVQRHLLFALRESDYTRSHLLETFNWDTAVVNETLDRLERENKLERRTVRYLDHDRRLQVDEVFRSRHDPGGAAHLFHTVTNKWVEVREPGAGADRGGVRLKVDAARVYIEAYPGRVFYSQGQRYRVLDWLQESPGSVPWVPCGIEDAYAQTGRIRDAALHFEQELGPPTPIGIEMEVRGFDVTYDELFYGPVRISTDLTSGKRVLEDSPPGNPRPTQFDTRALVLDLHQQRPRIELASVCQALRAVLPVHLAVDGEAFDVLALAGQRFRGVNLWGFAIVDLYPGGIGLVEEIRDDSKSILRLLGWAHDWLRNCSCNSDSGCENCLQPLDARSNLEQVSRAAALTLLGDLLTPGGPSRA